VIASAADELRAGVQKNVLAHDIKQAMKAKGISPSEMARRVSVTTSTMSHEN
jgi:hypothetical protein